MRQDVRILLAAIVAPLAMATVFPRSAAAEVTPGIGPENIVILVNDRVPQGVELGTYYAQKRGIPTENICHLQTTDAEIVSREDYDKQILAPLTEFLDKRLGKVRVKLPEGELVLMMDQKQIRCLVPMFGVPLKIDGFISVKEMYKSMAAGVDSELALLPKRGHLLGGAAGSPYYNADMPFNDLLARHMLLVCRLDGPSPEIVRRMIDDALWAEANGLSGRAYFDVRNIDKGGYAQGDRWIREACRLMTEAGVPSTLDEKAEVMSIGQKMPEACYYMGWYMENVSGAIARPDFKFERGAVAYHLHSFSALTIRSTTQRWVGPLLAHGAAATMGSVYEPYLRGTPHVDVFTDRLLKGYTFAEAGYMSQEMLSWTMTFVGDPLYRPFAKPFRQPAGGSDTPEKKPPAPQE
ncbi:MAG: TIGR03790 family protein [Planctomycetes bacterium]|nr:TIGR03790 family protein [Planctomycetota bacterium]